MPEPTLPYGIAGATSTAGSTGAAGTTGAADSVGHERIACGADSADSDAGSGELPLDSMKVVLVEDDDDIRAMIVRVLSKAGANVTACAGARVAKQALGNSRFDAAVLDCHLADLAGDSVIDYLGLSDDTLRERVVLVTGSFMSRGHGCRVVESGCTLITKPFRPAQLVEALASIGRPAP